ncbi:uncharacterized protein LOC127178612 [Labeo rohita]|uniref:uncharacterized protein LOC127178612 n=1 Tax=Labeo rohita TaxID=84645 RepID=UPI0021E32DBF|nr:uncharacterized protein LOC127178612 [Labeo rohita]
MAGGPEEEGHQRHGGDAVQSHRMNSTFDLQYMSMCEVYFRVMLTEACRVQVQLYCTERLYMMKCFQLSYFQLLYLLIAASLECEVATKRCCEQVHQLNINCFQGDSMSISCLTTTHPLQSLTVKLSSINQDKDILIYPDFFSTSEHQRWSVRKHAGNVTLDLKDIRLSDGGLYDCQVYKDRDCLHAIRFKLTIIKCKILTSVHQPPGSSVLLPCFEHPLQNRTERVSWKVVIGHQPMDISQYHPPNKPSNSTEKLLMPLYERATQLANGSLLIRDAAHIDQLWYQCRVNDSNCYEMKLLLRKDIVPAPADSMVGQTEESAAVTVNLTVVIVTTVVSLCALISLTVCVILCFKKRRSRINSQMATQRRCKQVHYLNKNCVQGDNMSISCITTTHPLQSLTVKLRRTSQEKDILIYPDIFPPSEHQRWSVRKDAGNVTLDLKDIRLSDDGLYDCQVYKGWDCLNIIRFNLKVKECKTLDSVHPTPGSSVLLPCSEHPLQHRTEQVTWKVVIGHQSTDITQYHPPNRPSSSTDKLLRPLYVRARQLNNGSLHIRDVADIDELWYRCSVNEKTCYEVKLLLKVITDAPAPGDNMVGQSEDNSDESEAVTNETVTTNVTVVVMITIVSLSVLISLTVYVILKYLKKRRPKTDNQMATQRRCKQVHQLNINCIQGDSMSISCLTTTHSLESLTVKLHRTNQDKNILMYPISPALEHQRWSVRKDDGNVVLDLKNIRLSDDGLYDCQVYKDQDCLHATRFNLTIITLELDTYSLASAGRAPGREEDKRPEVRLAVVLRRGL